MSDKLELWNKVCETNPADTKQVSFGRKFTAIDAYSQIRSATKQFGAYGENWGIREINHTFVPGTTMVLAVGTFFIPNGESVISSSIFYVSEKGKPDDDFAKKLETDMITKALSRLGFNADVFLGKFDDNKYVAAMNEKAKKTMDTKPIDLERVDTAAKFFKEQIDKDQIDETYEIIQAAYNRLTSDEQIEAYSYLKDKAPDCNKMYSTLLKEYLAYIPAQ